MGVTSPGAFTGPPAVSHSLKTVFLRTKLVASVVAGTSVGTFLAAHGPAGTTASAFWACYVPSTFDGVSSPSVTAAPVSTTPLLTTNALAIVSPVAFKEHEDVLSVPGVISEEIHSCTSAFVVLSGTVMVAASGAGRVTGEVTVAATALGNAVNTLLSPESACPSMMVALGETGHVLGS